MIRNMTSALVVVLFIVLFVVDPVFAQEQAAPAQPSTWQFALGTLQFVGIGFFVYYLLVILPRNTAETERQKFLSNLKKGDEVVTSGGLLGKVVQVKDETITLELASSVKIRVLPTHVRSRSSTKQSEETATKKSASKKTANKKMF